MTEGTVQNKDLFLNKISDKLGRNRLEQVALPKWKFQPQWKIYQNDSAAELLATFRKNSEAKAVYVVETEKANLAETLWNVFAKYGGGPVVATRDSRFAAYDLVSLLEDAEAHTWDAALGTENISITKKANIGLFFSDIALAESGTIVQFNDKDIARSVSLLPITYVALVPKSSIVPRMTQATQKIGKLVQEKQDIATCINFISGPSNSADIEMDIVIGVHGPVEAVHIVITDE